MTAVALPADAYTPSRTRVLFRLELAEALRSRWLSFTAVAYAGVFGVFVWLGLRESSVLGFTGVSRVVLNASNAVVVVLPLVALVSTCQAVVRARSTGYFELFLTHPCERADWLAAVVWSRALVLCGPLLALLGVTAASGYILGEPIVGALVLRSAIVTGALVWAFIGVGLLVSSLAPSSERAIVWALLVWLLVAAVHDFAIVGVLLKMHLSPAVVFALAATNPVELARLALLSVVDPDLAVLGPVGFWLSNTLGANLTFFAGAAWPLVLGTLGLVATTRRLNALDLVG